MVVKKKFIIERKEIVDNKEVYKIRRMLSEDRLLSLVLVVAYLKEPATITEITEECSKIEFYSIPRATVWKKIKTLNAFGLVRVKEIVDVLSSTSDPEDGIIRSKWLKFVKKFEGNRYMVKRFKSMIFVLVTEKGENFLEWVIERHKLPFGIKRVK